MVKSFLREHGSMVGVSLADCWSIIAPGLEILGRRLLTRRQAQKSVVASEKYVPIAGRVEVQAMPETHERHRELR